LAVFFVVSAAFIWLICIFTAVFTESNAIFYFTSEVYYYQS